MFDTVEKCHTRKDTKQVLRYVNRLRKQLKMKPLKYLAVGQGGEASKCSIAESLNSKYTEAHVDSGHILINRYSRLRYNTVGSVVQTIDVEPPQYVNEWIRAFDAGHMPGLLAK